MHVSISWTDKELWPICSPGRTNLCSATKAAAHRLLSRTQKKIKSSEPLSPSVTNRKVPGAWGQKFNCDAVPVTANTFVLPWKEQEWAFSEGPGPMGPLTSWYPMLLIAPSKTCYARSGA